MKAVFNDATEMNIQSCGVENGKLHIKTIVPLEELREKFSDEFACRRIDIIERGQTTATYENYTKLYRLEEYTGKIYGVVLEPVGTGSTTEERVIALEEALNIIVGGEA